MKRFRAVTDQLQDMGTMEAIRPGFVKQHRKLLPGHVYFLNRQMLSSKGRLVSEAEGSRSFYDVLADTIEDPDIHLFLFIDEAHRGLGSDGTPDSVNKTIYAKLIDGQQGKNPPMPNVVGISATPERFEAAMRGRKDRDMKAPIHVPVSAVRDSGLIKDTIELRTPKKAANTRHQDLTQACMKLAQTSKNWQEYCTQNNVKPTVVPLMVVQVEDKVTQETLGSLCTQICKTLPWLDPTDCFANVFGEHEDITTPAGKIFYCPPEDVTERKEIRVLFAKDAISTGWDCPRAEVIYSRRKRSDPTYIAQLIGRMIRTPLARRVAFMEELNTVACYLPEYDADTVDLVVERLRDDSIAGATTAIIKNPADVSWFGDIRQNLEQRLARVRTRQREGELSQPGLPVQDALPQVSAQADNDFYVCLPEDFEPADPDQAEETERELKEALQRIPQVDSEAVKRCFEGIITRQVRHDRPNLFLDLWDCIDIICGDIDRDAQLEQDIQREFYNNVEGEIQRRPAEFRRAYNEIRNTTVSIKRVDPLTGEMFEDREELVENDANRMTIYYRRVVGVFAGASDLIKAYINRRRDEALDGEMAAVGRICAVGACVEIVQAMEVWAENKTRELLDIYGPQRYAVSEENREKWDRIEGNTRPYIERELRIQASITRQNKAYEAYPKHIISDADGWAYLKLNDLEKKVVRTELARAMNVAWYRNQSRNLNASLSIAYFMDGEWENMYPDFIFFQQMEDGRIARTIVDPHGDWLSDSVAKLKGYVLYLRDHPKIFGSVQVVAEGRDGVCRYLDLMVPEVQSAIDTFAGSSAKELFHGPLSRVYHVRAAELEDNCR